MWHPETHDKIEDEGGHCMDQEDSKLGERYNPEQLLGQSTLGKDVNQLSLCHQLGSSDGQCVPRGSRKALFSSDLK